MKTRIHFLDNLRTFLIFLVVVLHSGLVYESVLTNNWIVIDPIQNSSIGLIRMYLDLFIMFIMFFISGYFIPFSTENRSTLRFLKSKLKRIMLPWIIAVFTLIPAYKAVFLYSRGLPQEEWFSYFHLFQRNGSDLSFFSNSPIQGWLWFLPVLFLFQMLYYALKRSKLLSIKVSVKKAVVLLLAIGLLYSMAISRMGQTGWFNSPILHFQKERLLVYFMAFLLGSLCNKLKVFESDRKNKKYYIISNIILTVSISIYTVVALNLFFNMIDPSRNYFFISGMVDRIIYYISVILSMLSFLYVLIHVFRFNFNRTNKLMIQLNKNSYQVYIIHMIVLGVIALLMINLALPAFVKFILLSTLTFAFSNGIVYVYRLLVKES
ncbi:MAG: acyltransferase [Bacteroidetes bacterium]|nr:acyltransferase [Bacteroidota bacterium]